MSVFYDHFERHAKGEGLKGRSTHYCPGCGHGLVLRHMAEAIEALDIQDRTIWGTFTMLAGALSLSAAMNSSGLGKYLADIIHPIAAGHSWWVI